MTRTGCALVAIAEWQTADDVSMDLVREGFRRLTPDPIISGPTFVEYRHHSHSVQLAVFEAQFRDTWRARIVRWMRRGK